MQNHGRILRLIVLIISNIIVIALVCAGLNFAYTQQNIELHQKTLYYLYKNPISSKQNAQIPVGEQPSGIGVDMGPYVSIVYVANSGDNTVSVIDEQSNTKIGKDIPVGHDPIGIAVLMSYGRVYVANFRDNTVSVINGTSNTKIGKDIPVGRNPSDIGVDDFTHTIYVANAGDNTVSVINGTSNTKIGKDIPVGSIPNDIAVDDFTHTIYVANFRDNTVSVINGTSNTKIGKGIPVGRGPGAIGVDDVTDTIYVANADDNTVSVINATSNTKIGKGIPVGSGPAAIGTDSLTKTIYVANNGDNTVSVIDGKTNKVVARVMFKTEPFNAGYIECGEDKLKAPISQQIYVWSGSECTAKPYQDFEFVSWQEDLGHNSTQLISLVPPPSIVDSILDFLHMNPDKPETRLNITKFGNFTANFKALPPPIPPVYIVTLFGIVVTAFVSSWLTPAIIGRRKTKMQRKYLKECINQIDKLDKNAIEEKIIGYYVDGKISQEHRQLLNDKISEYYKKEKGSEGHG